MHLGDCMQMHLRTRMLMRWRTRVQIHPRDCMQMHLLIRMLMRWRTRVDRMSTRPNTSYSSTWYALFCL